MERRLTRREFLERSWKTCLVLGGGTFSFSSLLRSSDSHASKIPEIFCEARFYDKRSHQKVKCHLCFRGCEISDGQRGFCRNRENIKGTLYSMVYAKPAALQIDPIEKEPSFHMIPGSHIFCTATASCNFRCKFCQNWHLSQRSMEEIPYTNLKPEEIVRRAIREHCEAVSFTYSEPTVFYEYMFDIIKMAKQKGLKTLFHTNGSISTDPLLALLKYMDAVTVDLKAFTEKFYSEVSSSELEPVLHTLRTVKTYGRHLEIVNLLIPTLNDNPKDIQEMCIWIKTNLGKDTPVHFNRFFPQYKLTNLPPTPVETLEHAYRIAKEEGLEYVYIGNVPGHKMNSTFCPRCKKRIIYRTHFLVSSQEVKNGKCRFCGYPIKGIWS